MKPETYAVVATTTAAPLLDARRGRGQAFLVNLGPGTAFLTTREGMGASEGTPLVPGGVAALDDRIADEPHWVATLLGTADIRVYVGQGFTLAGVQPGAGYTTPVALTSPPATLTAGANTLTFASAVYAIDIGNSSSVDVRWRVGGAAGPGSDPVRAGSSGTVTIPGGTTTISLYVPSTVALNDPTTAENCNVAGRA